MNFEPGVTPCTASFSPLQQDLAFEFGVDIINHLQSPSSKFELIALRYSASREIDNGVTPPTLSTCAQSDLKLSINWQLRKRSK